MEVKKIYYTMGEVAEMFDVSTSLIRYWEKHFNIIKPERNKKGNRLFTPADVENFKKIYHLVKERGMTLEGAKKSLRGASGAAINREVELMERLQKIRSLLLEVRQELKEEDEESIIEEPMEIAAPIVQPEMAEQVVEQPLEEEIGEEPKEQIIMEESTEEESIEEEPTEEEPVVMIQPKATQPDGEDKELFAFYEQKLF